MTKRLKMALLFDAIQVQVKLLEKHTLHDDVTAYVLAIEALTQSGFEACSKLTPPRREKATLTVIG